MIARRPEGKKLGGLWEFPGGKVEAGEMPEQALVRELHEELELRIEVKQALGSYDYTYDWGAMTLLVYVVKALNTPQCSADVPEFRFVDPRSVGEFPLAPADVQPWRDYLNRPT